MRLAPALDATEIALYLTDYEQSMLMPFGGPAAPVRDQQPIEGTVPGRVFCTGQTIDTSADGTYRLWLPMIDGTERIGVLELVRKSPADPDSWSDYQIFASLLSEAIVSRRMYGDAVECARRRLPMQVAAEIIWNQLPPLTFATDEVAVSAILEPCYDVGGDAFDYAINGDTLHIAVFDAVGHGIAASALTSLAISAYRNARRCGLDLSDTYRSLDKWVHAEHPAHFVTAALSELNITTGRYRRISAGHPSELLFRGGKLVKELDSPTAMPLGWGHLDDPIPQVSEESLEPGDKILVYTDGVVEARTEAGDFFGTDRLTDFLTRALADELPGPETMRRLVHAILIHQHERLQDDATAALVEWRPHFTYGHLPL
jgi:sigma-B regulation protein RsbU (phosphoserine phosphatase)